jgi:hypothetical protein
MFASAGSVAVRLCPSGIVVGRVLSPTVEKHSGIDVLSIGKGTYPFLIAMMLLLMPQRKHP